MEEERGGSGRAGPHARYGFADARDWGFCTMAKRVINPNSRQSRNRGYRKSREVLHKWFLAFACCNSFWFLARVKTREIVRLVRLLPLSRKKPNSVATTNTPYTTAWRERRTKLSSLCHVAFQFGIPNSKGKATSQYPTSHLTSGKFQTSTRDAQQARRSSPSINKQSEISAGWHRVIFDSP